MGQKRKNKTAQGMRHKPNFGRKGPYISNDTTLLNNYAVAAYGTMSSSVDSQVLQGNGDPMSNEILAINASGQGSLDPYEFATLRNTFKVSSMVRPKQY